MTQYKDFSKASVISFDVETYDPDLLVKGPAIHRGGFVLGFSLADETGFAEYYNLGHPDCAATEKNDNMDYLKEVMSFDIPKLGMNILYDLDWIQNFLDIKVKGKWWDIMVAESLINENQRKYNLDFMANKYLGVRKVKTLIDDYCEYHNLKGDSRMWLWKMSYTTVKSYAIGDVKLPLEIFKIQWKIMEQENLLDLFHLEMRGFPLLIEMRQTGVNIDEKKLSKVEDIYCDRLIEYEDQLYEIAGFELNYRASQAIGKVCDTLGLSYPQTEKTMKPSFTKQWLENNKDKHDLFALVLECRKYSNMINKFLESQMKNQINEGKIYTSFHPCKTDDSGTVTGRLSSSKPNLQNVPGNDLVIKKDIRSLFLPPKNMWWGRLDYKQIEIKLLAHYATGPGAEDIRQAFINDPLIDFHQWCAGIAKCTRKWAKNINFGIYYGMGVFLLCQKLNLTLEEGEAFLDMYLNKFPFLKATLYSLKNKAELRGFVKTILGRRRRFPSKEKTYRALNAVIQGSAADIMKKSMVDAWEAGIYDVLIPLLTVHDEMDTGIPKNKIGLEAFAELENIMINTVKLKIPLTVDMEYGDNWGSLQSYSPKQGVLIL